MRLIGRQFQETKEGIAEGTIREFKLEGEGRKEETETVREENFTS